MLFIFPMWDNESQRIGKQKCTPTGYALHAIAELLGFVGGLSFLGVAIFLGYRGITGNFNASLLWFLAVPFGVGVIAEVLFQVSWLLATRRGFEYDYENRVASWIENDKRVTYKWEQNNTSEHIP
jgi:hypothetical protein